MPFCSGDIIGSYTLVKKCGRGAYGEVWRVVDSIGRPMAMKIFDKVGGGEAELAGLRAYSKLEPHKNLITFFHIGEEADFYYYTMELADNISQTTGEYIPATLDKIWKMRGHIPALEVAQRGLELLGGLKALHHAGLIHRDIKPENIIFVKGVPKISDIGLVLEVDMTGSLNGTLGFLPPERLLGKVRGKYTVTDDLYALGKVLYYLWTGNTPESYPSLSQYCMSSRADACMNSILKKACNNRAEKRFSGAEDFESALKELVQMRDAEKGVFSSRKTRKLTKVCVAIICFIVILCCGYAMKSGIADWFGHDEPQVGETRDQAQAGEGSVNPEADGGDIVRFAVDYDPAAIPSWYNQTNNLPAEQTWVPEDAQYAVVDLSGGPEAPEFPVRFTAEGPDITSDICRTTELWLRRIPAGVFTMGGSLIPGGRGVWRYSPHEVTISRDYFIGVFEVTQAQWQLVTGKNPAIFKGDSRPVEGVSYSEIRGRSEEQGGGWPVSGHAVDAESFLGILRAKTRLVFDLPTSAQWEYAFKGGQAGKSSGQDFPGFNERSRNAANLQDGKGGYKQHTRVGSYEANSWGLYDMLGNVQEYCLDWSGGDWDAGRDAVNPTGPIAHGTRVSRGGSWRVAKSQLSDFDARGKMIDVKDDDNGLRLTLLPYEALSSEMRQEQQKPEYIVIDISSGPESTHYPVYYVNTGSFVSRSNVLPTEIWLKRIPAGTFMMGSPETEFGRESQEIQHEVTLTNDYYVGIFEVTQKQFMLVCGQKEWERRGDMRPADWLTYENVRNGVGRQWPAEGHCVDYSSFIGKLQARTGLKFDLPTEAEWEYACRAGTTKALYVDGGVDVTFARVDPAVNRMGVYQGNRHVRINDTDTFHEHKEVGLFPPNPWGLYDMQGNVWEYCLDWYGPYDLSQSVNPKGPSYSLSNRRVLRGGDWLSYAKEMRSAYRRLGIALETAYNTGGFRIVYPVDAPPLPPQTMSTILE